MKNTIVLLLINSLFIHSMVSQTLIQKIESNYNALDSISYIESMIFSFKNHVANEINETNNVMLELRCLDYQNMDYLHKQNIIDSIMGIPMYSQSLIKERTGWFASYIKDNFAFYVLNLKVESCDNQIYLLPDTNSLAFNLFYFDKRSNIRFFVLVDNGQISHYDNIYRTHSKQVGKNAPKAFRKILRKNPKYLLYCYDLEQMNTILYVLNNKIYVFRIAQMEEYELNDYIEKFMFH